MEYSIITRFFYVYEKLFYVETAVNDVFLGLNWRFEGEVWEFYWKFFIRFWRFLIFFFVKFSLDKLLNNVKLYLTSQVWRFFITWLWIVMFNLIYLVKLRNWFHNFSFTISIFIYFQPNLPLKSSNSFPS